jgi:nucleotide-binding universal stress UspA family protein
MTPTFQRILVATDFGPSSAGTIEYASTLAMKLGACVHLVHVLEEPFMTAGPHRFHLPDTPERRELMYVEARARLSRLAGGLSAWGGRNTVDVRAGAAADAIAQAVIDYGADMLVVGTHGRTALQRLLIGSVADRLVRTAACPVLVVREAKAAEPVQEVEALAVV